MKTPSLFAPKCAKRERENEYIVTENWICKINSKVVESFDFHCD
jgi:hypothetical protein